MGNVKVARIAPNTLNTRRVPIVFVPGVMGSRLYLSESNTYWDPDSTWRMKGWLTYPTSSTMEWMDFRQPGTVMTEQDKTYVSDSEKGRGWEGVVGSFYAAFLRQLDNTSFAPNTCRVYAVGYDWRQTNRRSGKYFAAQLDKILAAEKAEQAIVLTHSMGGLVTRSGMKDSCAGKVLGIVHVVQPVLGAVTFYRRLFTGTVGSTDGGWALATVLGDTGPQFTAIVSGLPGPVELMPNAKYRAAGGANWLNYIDDSGAQQSWTANAYDCYLSSVCPPGVPDSDVATGVLANLHARIAAARDFHSNFLQNYKLPNKTYSIYGTALGTDTSILFNPAKQPPPQTHYGRGGIAYKLPAPWPNHGAHMQRTATGDGTVPPTSASALFPDQTTATAFDPKNTTQRQYIVNGMEHGAAYQNSTAQQMILGIIKQLLAG
jgi:pimeloyl-ACP methyl ester carboxylesterase